MWVARTDMTPVLDRVLDKIEVTDACWIWTGARNNRGYGQIRDENAQMVMAHRAVWEAVVGPIPDGLVLDHLCRVQWCVNPDHLEPVTQAENLLRGTTVNAAHASRTHCPQGHPYAPPHLIIERDGSRKCRTCKNNRRRKR